MRFFWLAQFQQAFTVGDHKRHISGEKSQCAFKRLERVSWLIKCNECLAECNMIGDDLGILVYEILEYVQRIPVLLITNIGQRPTVTFDVVLVVIAALFKVSHTFCRRIHSRYGQARLGDAVTNRVVAADMRVTASPVSRLGNARSGDRVCHQELRCTLVGRTRRLSRHHFKKRRHAIGVKASVSKCRNSHPVSFVFIRAGEIDLLLRCGSLGNRHTCSSDIRVAANYTGNQCAEHQGGAQKALS